MLATTFIAYCYGLDSCEPPRGFWELNSGPLEEEAVLLTDEPSLQPCFLLFKKKKSGGGGGEHFFV
jgi:hypothetical protein